MTIDAWITALVLLLVLGMLISSRRSPDIILIGGAAILALTGVLTPTQALAGLANEGVVTIVILFAVAAGLKETGAMNWIGQFLMGGQASLPAAQTRIMLPSAVMSAFMNNTPLVAIMLPVVDDWAKRHEVALSKLLIPLSYASIFGGACTLIGTSTNLIINGWLIEETGHPGLTMFELAWVGVPCAIIGIGFILLTSRWLLPDRKAAISTDDDPRSYTVETVVDDKGPLVGKTIEQAGLRRLPGLFLIEIERDDQVIAAVSPHETLRGNDRLVFAGVIDSMLDLHKINGLIPAGDQLFKLDAPRSTRTLIEATVSDTCPIIGKSIRQTGFRSLYNAVVIAVARNGHRIKGRIGDITLKPGDTLLLEARPSFINEQKNSRDFYLISQVYDSQPPKHEKTPIALAILALMVIVVAFGWLSMFNAAILAAGLMIVTGCSSANSARRAIDWSVYLAIAASIAIGKAMQVSGLADVIAKPLIAIADGDPTFALAIIYGLSMVMAAIVNAKAAAVLMLPIAFAAAGDMTVSYMPFLMAVLFACSTTIATPMGYPTNLMVYGPGGYLFSDYLRIGLPISLILWIVCVVLIPFVWGFKFEDYTNLQ